MKKSSELINTGPSQFANNIVKKYTKSASSSVMNAMILLFHNCYSYCYMFFDKPKLMQNSDGITDDWLIATSDVSYKSDKVGHYMKISVANFSDQSYTTAAVAPDYSIVAIARRYRSQ